MFNIGPMELIVILLVALLVVGPKRLPEVGRSIGKALREFRRTTEEVRSSFEASLDEEPSPNGEVAPGTVVEPDDVSAQDQPGREPTPAEPPGEEPGSAPPADRG